MTTTFNAVTGRSLTRALESLSASTTLTVTVGGIEYRGERLRSPYLSHQSVSVRVSPDAPLLGVLLENERFTVYAVGPLSGALAHQPAPPAGMEWHEAVVPASAVSAAAARLTAIVPGLGALLAAHLPSGSPLVAVSILMPRLIGWDEDGRPVYAEPAPEPAGDVLAGITEACFSPDDEPPAPADDDPEPGGEETA